MFSGATPEKNLKKILGKIFDATSRKRKRRSLQRRSHLLMLIRRPLRHRLDARGEARHATRGGVLGHDVLGSTALDLRLRGAQSIRGGLLVSRLDRFLDLLDRATDAAAARGVHGGAALRLACALLGRL